MKTVTILLAIVIDLLFGDPPNRWHPTAWMGSLISYTKSWWSKTAGKENDLLGHNSPPAPSDSWALYTSSGRASAITHKDAAEMALGAVTVLGGMGMVTGISAVLAWLCSCLPAPFDLLAQAALLKTTFSLHGLDRAAGEVQSALAMGDLPKARRSLAWHLVSRDTSTLDEALVAAATVESIAENTSDGVIAPLFYYVVGGLPAAVAYRFANTADAMLGYHTPELEWLGKAPARLDDLLNLLPARLTGLLIALAAPLAGGDIRNALLAMRKDAHRTQSPNAGYPMSAMAGALEVELEKHGHYKLGAGGRSATAADIHRARRTMLATTWLFVAAVAGWRACLVHTAEPDSCEWVRSSGLIVDKPSEILYNLIKIKTEIIDSCQKSEDI